MCGRYSGSQKCTWERSRSYSRGNDDRWTFYGRKSRKFRVYLSRRSRFYKGTKRRMSVSLGVEDGKPKV